MHAPTCSVSDVHHCLPRITNRHTFLLHHHDGKWNTLCVLFDIIWQGWELNTLTCLPGSKGHKGCLKREVCPKEERMQKSGHKLWTTQLQPISATPYLSSAVMLPWQQQECHWRCLPRCILKCYFLHWQCTMHFQSTRPCLHWEVRYSNVMHQ